MRKKQYDNPHLKMYILVRKRAPVGVAAVNAAHVALMAYDKFKHDKDMKKWFNPGPFYKVLVAVTDKEWKAAKRVRDHVLIREDMWGDREVAMAFKPRLNWPKAFREFPFFPAKKTRKKRRRSIRWIDIKAASPSGKSWGPMSDPIKDSPAYGM